MFSIVFNKKQQKFVKHWSRFTSRKKSDILIWVSFYVYLRTTRNINSFES